MLYIGYYDTVSNSDENRNYTLSAKTKMDYVIDALNSIGIPVEIVSASRTRNKRCYKGKRIALNHKNSLKLFFTFGQYNWMTRCLRKLAAKVQMFGYLFFHVKRDETIMVYHSLAYSTEIRLLTKLRKCKVILELEEIYGDVSEDSMAKRREIAYVSIANGYIFPTKLLNVTVNSENKPFTIAHGTYHVEPDRKCKFSDCKIHVLYAGTMDPRKGGAAAAAAAAAFLPKCYHVHILGFGSEKDKAHLRDVITETAKLSEATITYDGLLSGEEYIRFVQSCDIGLSTQNPDAAFNATSFPSKVLSYMSNGLKVVSVRIPAVEQSDVGDLITYYDEQTPQEIAKAIMRVDMDAPYDSRKRISELNEKFTIELKQMIEGLSRNA